MKHSQFSKKRLTVYISAILATGMGSQVFAEEILSFINQYIFNRDVEWWGNVLFVSLPAAQSV